MSMQNLDSYPSYVESLQDYCGDFKNIAATLMLGRVIRLAI